MVTSWYEIRGKIKHAHDEIESAYQKHVVSAVDKVKERPILNTAVKMSLSAIPIIGPNLRDLYDNIGGETKSEDDKAELILEFLVKLEQQNKQQFYRIAQDLQVNHHEIIDAINDEKILIADLISKSSMEILKEIGSVKEDTRAIRDGVDKIQEILEKDQPIASEIRHPSKPSCFRGETNIFVGRREDRDKIQQYLIESNAPMAIVGEGGLGKSALAFKAIHECEDMFEVIIPVYLESFSTFNSFLLEMARSLQLTMTIEQFELLDNDNEKTEIILHALSRNRRVLIYADNYETIKDSIVGLGKSHAEQLSSREEAKKVNSFLKCVPSNTCILLTSQYKQNLSGERLIQLRGLTPEDGRDLFIRLAAGKLPKYIPNEIRKAIEQIAERTGGHPLSIQILASTYGEDLLPELKEMLKHLGAGVVDPERETGSRHESLEACFEYSISRLPESHKLLLPKLAFMFNSPFPVSAAENIFGSLGESTKSTTTAILRDLYNSSLLRRIDFDKYGDIEGKYRLYYFHPSVKNYLRYKALQEEGNKKEQELEEKYGSSFSQYYFKLIQQTFNAIGKEHHVLALERFMVIVSQGKDNDFERAITLSNDESLITGISSYLGLILYNLGMYDEALLWHKKSLAIHEQRGNSKLMGRAYTNIGVAYFSQGNYNQALEYFNKSLAIHEHLQDDIRIAKAHTNIGNVFASLDKHGQALKHYKKSLEIHEQLRDKGKLQDNDKIETARTYGNMGIILELQNKYNQALEYHYKALEIHEQLRNRIGIAKDYTNIGLVYFSQGNYNQALEYHYKALEIHEQLRNRIGIAKAYSNIGRAFSQLMNDKAKAIESFSMGLESLKEHEKETGYHHPLNNQIQLHISELQNKKEKNYD